MRAFPFINFHYFFIFYSYILVKQYISCLNLNMNRSIFLNELKNKQKKPERCPQKKFTIKDFELGSCIGKGKFSQVFIAREKTHGFYVALKIMDKKYLHQFGLENQIERQIILHNKSKHNNILQLYGYFHNKTTLYLILELSDQGDLYTYLKQRKRFTQYQAKKIIKQVCLALKFLHQNNIIHRDIKPENIMICNGVAKLADFGLASYNGKRNTFCGTMDYIAPEMFGRAGHNEKVDIWSIGVLAYQLCRGEPPFIGSDQNEMQKLIKFEQVKYPQWFSSELKEFISSILTKNDERRPNIKNVLQKSWLNSE